MNSYHILNGDCLADNFPAEIPGELIIWRECLTDGPVAGKGFFEIRKNYLDDTYRIDADYEVMVVSEWLKITQIPVDSNVYLWFEEDAFCQANLWFIFSELISCSLDVFRVLPDFQNGVFKGFGNIQNTDFLRLFRQAVPAQPRDYEVSVDLWSAYVKDDFQKLKSLSAYSSAFFPNLAASVDTVIEVRSGEIRRLIEQLKLENGPDWKSAFSFFSNKFPQYGLGDLQFKKYYF